jgi:hypothetical protein
MTVAGRVKDGVLAARLASEGAAGFLEAQFQGSELLVTLIEPDEHQQPDPSRSSQLTLHRQGAPRPAGAPSPAATATASVSASASTTATASVTTAAPQPVTQWGWLRGRRLTPPPGSGEKEIYLCSDGSYLTGTAERGRWQVATGGGSPSLHLEPEAGPERGYDLDYDMSVRELSLDGERWISTNPNDRCR